MKESRFDFNNENQWCPGCGNFAILTAMKKAFEQNDLSPSEMLLVSGIGQAGKTPNYLACNMLHGLHGRALALATGAKIANSRLNILVNSGDGDCYGEGGNHFLAAIRRNIDITLLVHDNRIYGLTKGQASPTTAEGMPTKLQAGGVTSQAFNPIAVALAAGIGFAAQGFSGNIDQLSDLIVQGMNYKGFALIDIHQPCVSFNKINTHLWYKERVYDLVQTEHDETDLTAALNLAVMSEDRIPTGIIYRREMADYHDKVPVLKEKALVEYSFAKPEMNAILDAV